MVAEVENNDLVALKGQIREARRQLKVDPDYSIQVLRWVERLLIKYNPEEHSNPSSDVVY